MNGILLCMETGTVHSEVLFSIVGDVDNFSDHNEHEVRSLQKDLKHSEPLTMETRIQSFFGQQRHLPASVYPGSSSGFCASSGALLLNGVWDGLVR
jgi:hypothetical protein